MRAKLMEEGDDGGGKLCVTVVHSGHEVMRSFA